MDDLLHIAKEYGPFAAITMYFIVQSAIRERRIMQRVADLETYIRQRLERIIEEATSAITEFNRKANK